MKKLFGNGRPLAAAVLAVGVAAIAVPAFGDSGTQASLAPHRGHGPARRAPWLSRHRRR